MQYVSSNRAAKMSEIQHSNQYDPPGLFTNFIWEQESADLKPTVSRWLVW